MKSILILFFVVEFIFIQKNCDAYQLRGFGMHSNLDYDQNEGRKLMNTFDDKSSNVNINEKKVEYENSISRENDLLPKKSMSFKSKPINYKGYSLDMSVETFKTMRYCHINEICKSRYRTYFECVCPKMSLCVGQGSLFEGRCNSHLMSYVWLQNLDESLIDTIKQ